MSRTNIGAYNDLSVTSLTSTELVGDFRLYGQPGYVVRFSGQGFGGDLNAGVALGTVDRVSEVLNGTLLFELSGVFIPAETVLSWIRTSNDSAALSRNLSGNDVIQGGAGDDTLLGFTGRNTILGGAGVDTAVISASRSNTQSFRFRDEAVVVRAGGGQVDQLAGVEILRFNDGTVAQSSLPAAQPFQYLASYADLTRAYGANEEAGWRHFAGAGLTEGRAVTFSGLNYLASYRDLASAYGTNAEAGARHYLSSGAAEGRTVTFNGVRYLAANRDLAGAFGTDTARAATHYIQSSAAEGRTVTFDPLRYLASNLDVARAYGTNEARGLDHWLENGFSDNRQTASFDVAQYLRNYAELSVAFGTDQRAATLHWIQTGAAEGRSAVRVPIYRESFCACFQVDAPTVISVLPTPLPL